MESWLVILMLTASTNVFAFALQDMPQMHRVTATKITRGYGAPVKLDLSYNQCVKKGDPAYGNTLFYEEFDSLAECQRARNRS